MLKFFSDAYHGIRAGRALRAEQRDSLANPSPALLQALLGAPTKSGAIVNDNTVFNVSVIRACVSLRANLLAMLPVKVFAKTPTGPVEQRDHPLSRLLRGRVSPSQTRFKWISAASVCFDIGGNAYSRIYRDQYADLVSIRFLLPASVQPLEHPSTGEMSYRVRGHGDLRAEQVLHVSNLSTNGLTGRSPLADLRESIGLALTAEEFTARTFANGNRKPGVLVGGPTMTQSKANDFLTFWMQQYAGTANAGKSPLLFGGMDWKDAGFSNADAELLGLRKFSIEEIARVYHLPLHLIGSTDRTTTWGSGIEQLNQGLVDYTLQPICTNWEAEMNTMLLTEQEQEEGYYVKFIVDALLRGSPETRAKVYQIMRGLAAMDVNQIRRLEEWPEYPDAWAGDPRQPLNNQGGGGATPNADQQAADAAAADQQRAAREERKHQETLATIRSLPKPEVHVAAPVVNFAERSIVADVQIAPPAINVAAPVVKFEERSIVADVQVSPPAVTVNLPKGDRTVQRDAQGRLTGIIDA